jgi:putative selenium metabolism protein SsnA
MPTLLQNATVATLDPPVVERTSLRIDGGVIAERGSSLRPLAGEDVVALDGGLVIPGLVNAHTHLYSALARGMPGLAEPPRTFVEILERVWWRLDRALDEETVYLSGLVGAIEAARSGTTLLVDHHSSPSFVRGSLDALRRAVDRVGLRSVLCYETTDRNGVAGRDEGLEENRTIAGASLVGAHASFTLSDESLDRLASVLRDRSSSLHIHVAEAHSDVEDSHRRCGAGVIERLRRHGLLLPRTVLVHGVHLDEAELRLAQDAGAWLVHCPRSNMNNGVGYARTAVFTRAALGTDGMDEDLLAEARAAFLKMKEVGREDALAATLAMLSGGHRLGRELLGLRLGSLEPGSPADLVLLDYCSPTPITAGNLGSHLLFGLDRSHVRSTMAAGQFVLRDRRLTLVEEAAICGRARGAAEGLWERMRP